mmetsp:Transcript_28159/g.63703  ORF Transcript_28159/g.63703 Transcript_28159/m.63703 type:complete len:314 (-) Transcript_28159:1044-1985(-)
MVADGVREGVETKRLAVARRRVELWCFPLPEEYVRRLLLELLAFLREQDRAHHASSVADVEVRVVAGHVEDIYEHGLARLGLREEQAAGQVQDLQLHLRALRLEDLEQLSEDVRSDLGDQMMVSPHHPDDACSCRSSLDILQTLDELLDDADPLLRSLLNQSPDHDHAFRHHLLVLGVGNERHEAAEASVREGGMPCCHPPDGLNGSSDEDGISRGVFDVRVELAHDQLRVALVDELRQDFELEESRGRAVVRSKEELLGRPIEHLRAAQNQRSNVLEHKVLSLPIVLEDSHEALADFDHLSSRSEIVKQSGH